MLLIHPTYVAKRDSIQIAISNFGMDKEWASSGNLDKYQIKIEN